MSILRYRGRLRLFFFFQAEDGIRDGRVTGVQTCALPILTASPDVPPTVNAGADVSENTGVPASLSGTRSEERRQGKSFGAAIIALPNDEDEIPMEPDKRLVLVRKVVEVATKEYGIPIEDI